MATSVPPIAVVPLAEPERKPALPVRVVADAVCVPSPRFMTTLTTPNMAPVPYMTELGPRTNSIRSMARKSSTRSVPTPADPNTGSLIG
jgi:hypothetical protein